MNPHHELVVDLIEYIDEIEQRNRRAAMIAVSLDEPTAARDAVIESIGDIRNFIERRLSGI